MDTVQIPCKLRDLEPYLYHFASDLVQRSIAENCPVLVNADPHPEVCSYWLAVLFWCKSSCAYHFDSYGIVPLVPDILVFITRNCTTWDHNGSQLLGLTSEVCGLY